MAYEVEALGSNVAGPNLPKETMREERVVDHRAQDRRIQAAQEAVAAKSGQSNTSANNVSSEEPQTPPVESVTLSPAAAALARKEAKFRQQQQELKTKEAELEAERKEIAELKAIKAKLASKDYSGVESFVDYNEYTNYLIEKGSQSTPEQEEIKKLASKLDNMEKAQKDDVSKRFDAAVNERRTAIKALVGSDETYSTIKGLKAEETVVQHILDTWEHDNIDLSVEQATKEVEDLLQEKATKWASLSKVPTQESQEKKELPPLKSGVKTLTNNMAPTGEIKRPQKSFEGMSETERYKEAYRRAQEKLKG
jgi:DNA-binding Lrp family transcriptional regulator